MWIDQAPLVTVFRRRENDGEPVNDRRLRDRVDRGEFVRVARGSFAPALEWHQLTPIARHAQFVWEIGARIRPGQVVSHFAAAALHGIDILGRWPAMLDVSIAASSGGRSSGSIRRHARTLTDVQTMPWQHHLVTTPLQTALDLIAALRLPEAVAVADQALWQRRRGGPLIARPALLEAAHSRVGRGTARALRAAAFATHLSDSVRESQSRVLIAAMGFPEPELQAHFVLSDGRDAFTDFFWREFAHVGEFDGAGKYRDPQLLRGRTPQQVLLDEKDREDDLRRQVRAFSRWRTRHLTSPRQLYDILHGAGLPATKPRPGR